MLAKLRKDISLLNLNRKKLGDGQKSMLDFIEGKKANSQYMFQNKIVQLCHGNEKFGFCHILLGHYEDGADGRLTAREILNLWSILENNSEITNYEKELKSEYKNRKAFRLQKTNQNIDIMLFIITFEDGIIDRILTSYSSRKS